MTDVPFIQVEDVYFSRGDNDIFRGVNMTIPRGKVTAIMGPSGTGKTTLLKLIGGQLTPDRGRILIDGNLLSTFFLLGSPGKDENDFNFCILAIKELYASSGARALLREKLDVRIRVRG